MTAVADGIGYGYELGFIPVENSDNDTTATDTNTVTINGTVDAGIYHALTITIPDCKNDGVFCAQIEVAPGGAPFLYTSIGGFDPVQYIKDNYDGAAEQALLSGVSTTPVRAFVFGHLFAAGGSVTIQGDAVLGTGTVRAHGGPKITVTNESPDYIVFAEGIEIPDLRGGRVLFTGTGGRGALNVQEIGADAAGTVTIHQNFDGPVGNSLFGPAILLEGIVENLGGVVGIESKSGSFGQAGQILSLQLNTLIPNGVVVLTADSAILHVAGNPYSQWKDFALWPGGMPGGTVSARDAIVYVANADFNPNGTLDQAALNNAVYNHAGATPPNNFAFVYFGACAPQAPPGDCTQGTARALSPIGGVREFGNADGSAKSWLPLIPAVPLRKTADSYGSASLASAAGTVVYSSRVVIQGQMLDINGRIEAGATAFATVRIPANIRVPLPRGCPPQAIFDFTVTLAYYRQLYEGGCPFATVHLPPTVDLMPFITRTNPDSSLIRATYDARTGTIVIDRVQAGSGGGEVTILGGILSTTNLGNIHVNGGLGHVEIDNDSGIPVTINDVFAGNSSSVAAVTSRVRIVDTFQNPNSNQFLYVFKPSEGLKVYQGPGGADPANVAPPDIEDPDHLVPGQPTGTEATFSPLANHRWVWRVVARLERDVDTATSTATDWRFTSGDPTTDPWLYITPGTGLETATPVGMRMLELGQQAFVQTITAVSGGASVADFIASAGPGTQGPVDTGQRPEVNVYYHSCGPNTCNYGYAHTGPSAVKSGQEGARYVYVYPDFARITMRFSVKADNPIKINFAGFAAGRVDITSNANVVLAGKIVNPSGDTTITVTNGGTFGAQAGSHITSETLAITSDVGIASAANPLAVTLVTRHVLSLRTGTAGAFVDVSSPVVLQAAQAGSAATGYGDIWIRATGGITPVAGTTSAEGFNVTLLSTNGGIGAGGTPVVVATHSIPSTFGATIGGELVAEALDSVFVRGIGNVKARSIVSTIGDVWVDAPSGSITDAGSRTAVSTLTGAQLAAIWARLALVGDAADASAAAAVTRFEGLVDTHLRRYWLLNTQGFLVAGVYVLNDAFVEQYRGQAEAAAGTSPRTEDQIRAYVRSLYDATIAFLTAHVAEFTMITPDPSFHYTATAQQRTDLTKNAKWTENELRSSVAIDALGEDSGTTIGAAQPTISGKLVTLFARDGIGRLAPAVTVTFADLISGNLTDEQRGALALARNPGDVAILVIVRGFALVVSLDQFRTVFDQNPGLAPFGILIRQRSPVFVAASTMFSALSGGVLYAQAASGDLLIGTITANGEVSLAAPGSLVQLTAGPIASLGSDVSLLAGAGTIGTATKPFKVHAPGVLRSAIAGTEVFIEWVIGDMRVERVAAPKVTLDAMAGSVFQVASGVAVRGTTVVIDAPVGGIGSTLTPLEVETTETGTIRATARDDINLLVAGDARVALVQTLGHATVQAEGAILDAGPGDGANVVATSLRLEAGTAIGAAGAPIAVTTLGGVLSAVADGGPLYLRVLGDALLAEIRAGNATDGFASLDLVAVGDLSATPQTAIRGGSMTLLSETGALGSLTAPLALEPDATGTIEATAQEGVNLRVTGDARIVRVVGSGGMQIRATGSIVDAAAGDGANVAGASVALDAGVGIGSAAAPFVVDAGGGVLRAVADAGALHLRVLSDALLTEIRAGNPVVGFTPLELVGVGSFGATPETAVVGGRMTLRSETGDVGRPDSPLTIWPTVELVTVDAAGHIGLVARGSHLLFDHVIAGGDVGVSVLDGALIAPASSTASQALTPEQVTAAFAALDGLTDPFEFLAVMRAGAPVGTATATIRGDNVALGARDGVGQAVAPVVILLADLLAGTLTDSQRAALVLALAPSDLTVDDTSWAVRDHQPMYIDASNVSASSEHGPVYLHSVSNLLVSSVTAAGDIVLAAPGSVSGGVVDSAREVRLASGLDVIDVEVASVVASAVAPNGVTIRSSDELVFDRIATGGDVVLGAAAGAITHRATSIGLRAASLTADARDAVQIDVGGNLVVHRIRAGTEVALTVEGSATAGTGPVHVTGATLVLTSKTGSLGTATAPLVLESTTVTVDAAGTVSLLEATGDLDVTDPDELVVALLASSGALRVTAGGAVTRGAVGVDNVVATIATITAASIGSAAAPLRTAVGTLVATAASVFVSEADNVALAIAAPVALSVTAGGDITGTTATPVLTLVAGLGIAITNTGAVRLDARAGAPLAFTTDADLTIDFVGATGAAAILTSTTGSIFGTHAAVGVDIAAGAVRLAAPMGQIGLPTAPVRISPCTLVGPVVQANGVWVACAAANAPAATLAVVAADDVFVDIEAASGADGYLLATPDGGVFAFGGAQFFGSMGGQLLQGAVVAVVRTPTGLGYYLVAEDGGVFAFGDGVFFGSLGGQHLNARIVGMAVTPTGRGYWLVGADGGVFAFGDAVFYGSMGRTPLNRPVVGITASPTGKGYILVGFDGGVFVFGDARFAGSMGGAPVNAPIVGIAAHSGGNGYWMVGFDGAVYAFGDAPFLGSMGGTQLVAPIVGMVAVPFTGDGYWLLGFDGGVFAFPSAPFRGSPQRPTPVAFGLAGVVGAPPPDSRRT
ncbi:MAG: hypothetical protein ABWZ15_16005 [Acidimicrobiia bacterium]